MRKIAFWTVTAGAALLAACGQQQSPDNAAADNALGLPPANMAASLEPENLTEANNVNSAEETMPQAGASAEDRAQPAVKAPADSTRPTPRERPAERRAAPSAPKQEPAPTPTSTCTPEHEAMGHCKQ